MVEAVLAIANVRSLDLDDNALKKRKASLQVDDFLGQIDKGEAGMTKSLWQFPRLRTADDPDEERRATWLELFYDLVFVAAIAQVAHSLSEHVSLSGYFGYVLLFVPIWWSWVGATFYATRFDTDDLGHRLLTLLQMIAIAVLAVNVHHGFPIYHLPLALLPLVLVWNMS